MLNIICADTLERCDEMKSMYDVPDDSVIIGFSMAEAFIPNNVVYIDSKCSRYSFNVLSRACAVFVVDDTIESYTIRHNERCPGCGSITGPCENQSCVRPTGEYQSLPELE